MAKLTYDENGEVVDYLAERNEEIKSNLEEVLEMFKAKEAANKNGKKNYGFMFSMQINNELNRRDGVADKETIEKLFTTTAFSNVNTSIITSQNTANTTPEATEAPTEPATFTTIE